MIVNSNLKAAIRQCTYGKLVRKHNSLSIGIRFGLVYILKFIIDSF